MSTELYSPSKRDTFFSRGYSNFSSDIDSKYIREDFEFVLNGKNVAGSAYITYCDAYHRFELLQVDNISKSSILLNGAWDDSSRHSITFYSPANYAQWGLPVNVSLQWKYLFDSSGSFTKEIWLADEKSATLSSVYRYTNSLNKINTGVVVYHQYSIPITGGSIFCRTIGSGEPIVLVNGGPGWSSDHIIPLAEMLSRNNFQVIIFDQRGTGESRLCSLDTNSITWNQMTADIEAVRNYFKIKSWIVVGHSLGAMLAMNYCTTHPETISKMILLAPGGMNLDFLEEYPASLNSRLSIENLQQIKFWMAKPESGQGLASMNIIYNTLPALIYNDSLANSLMDNIDTTTWRMQTASLVWDNLTKVGFDISKRLMHFHRPVLIVQGCQDALGNLLPVEIKKVLPNARIRFINNAAHILWADQPTEIEKVLSDFLK